MTVVVVSTAADDEHETPAWHPERPSRLGAVEEGVRLVEPDADLVWRPSRRATPDELARVHTASYLDDLRDLCGVGGGELDPDTPVVRGSWGTALAGAGGGLVAVEALRAGEADAAFVAIRPPGHHAMADRGSGFCLLNNVAVAAADLAAGGERVVVLDWDVHHGNGTQAIFWDHPDVLYVSLHQWPAYPGTGRATETGGPAAPGGIVNIPLPAGATGDVALAALEQVAAPAIAAFAPGWLLVSAGFDAHRDDPLADLAWTAGDYELLVHTASGLVGVPGRTVVFLEGGYDLDALRRSVASTVAALAGVPSPAHEPPSSGGAGMDHVVSAARLRRAALEGSP